jgi:hypothetical protein
VYVKNIDVAAMWKLAASVQNEAIISSASIDLEFISLRRSQLDIQGVSILTQDT